MKNLTFILLLFISSICLSQQKPYHDVLLTDWTIDNDTTIYRAYNYDYNWDCQFESLSTTGTYDGTIAVYHKMNGLDSWDLFSPDAIKTINTADWSHMFVGYDLMADSIKWEIVVNNITGGTANMKMKINRKD